MPTRQEDITYYQRRIEACEVWKDHTTCPSARLVHEELARLYRAKLDALLGPLKPRVTEPVAASAMADAGLTPLGDTP